MSQRPDRPSHAAGALRRWLSPLVLASLMATGPGCATMKARMSAQNAYTEGMGKLDGGDPSAAESSFQAGLAAGSTSAEANAHLYAGLAEAYLAQYRLTAAVEAAEKAVELNSDSTTLIALSQARLLNRDSQGAFDTAKLAVEHCNMVANSNPDLAKRCYADGFLALGRVVRAVGQYDFAIEQFDQAEANGTKPSRVMAEKAQVLNLKGEVDQGMAMAMEALEKDPTSEEALLARGTAEAIQGNADAARETLAPVLKKNPIASLEFLRVARTFVDKGQFERAVVMYELVASIQKSNPYVWMDLGYAYQQSSKPKEATDAYEQVLAVHPTLSAYAAAPDLDAFKARLSSDKEQGLIADDQVEFLVVAYTNLGNLRYSQADVEGARAAYERVIAADPTDVQVAVILAGMLTAEADQEAQVALLEGASKQTGLNRAELEKSKGSMKGDEYQAAVAEMNSLEADIEKRLGVTLYNMGRQADAAPHLARAVELAPDDPNIQLGLGLVLFNDEKFAEAIPHLEKALEVNPDDYGIIFSLGVSYRRSGDNAKAVKMLERAKKFQPQNKDIYLELHHAYKALGKNKEASDHRKMYESLP